MERILWTCKSKGAKLLIHHPTCTIELKPPLQLEFVSGDATECAKLIRDIEVLALDKNYYPVGDEESYVNEF
jgi:hypothetical protein